MVRRLVPLVALAVLVMLVATHWPSSSVSTVNEHCGIDQLRIRRTAEGHMLDLRYRVIDPDRARTLLAKDSTAYIVHDRSGRRLQVPNTPKAGALRNRGLPKAGRSYFALFANPGGLVRHGDRVTVVLGELTTHLTVE